MSLDFKQTVTIPDEVLSREVNGETVILDLNSECYLGLDEVGTRIWQLLKQHKNVQKVYVLILEEFDVGADTLAKDMKALIYELLDKGLNNETWQCKLEVLIFMSY